VTSTLFDRLTLAAAFLVLTAFFPYFEAIHSANELSRLYLANAIVEEGSVSIDGQLQRLGNIHDKALRDGHYYSDKAPGAAFLAVPVVWLYYQVADQPSLRSEMRWARLWVNTLPTCLLLLILLGFLKEHFKDDRLIRVLLISYAFGTLATTYSQLLFGHQLGAVLVFACFLVVRRAEPHNPGWLGPAAGFLASAAVCVEYQNALFLLPLAVLYMVRTRARVRPVVMALLGAAPLAIALGLYHDAAFGSPFTTGYSFVASNFKEVHAQGFMGIAGPKWAHVVVSFVAPRKGLFFFAPFLLLAVPGLVLLRRAGPDGLVTGIMVALYSLFVVSMVYPDGGWTVSQRHLTPMVPWLLLPIGLLVTRFADARPVLCGLAGAAIVITGISTIVWPHYQEQLLNPFFSIGWPLFRDGWLPQSHFSALGIASKTGATLIAVAVAAAGVYDLIVSAKSTIRRAVWPLAAMVIAAGFIYTASTFHPDQDVERDRRWIESVYELDPAAPSPTAR